MKTISSPKGRNVLQAAGLGVRDNIPAGNYYHGAKEKVNLLWFYCTSNDSASRALLLLRSRQSGHIPFAVVPECRPSDRMSKHKFGQVRDQKSEAGHLCCAVTKVKVSSKIGKQLS